MSGTDKPLFVSLTSGQQPEEKPTMRNGLIFLVATLILLTAAPLTAGNVGELNSDLVRTGSVSYTIERGDSLWSIKGRFCPLYPWNDFQLDVWAFNGFDSDILRQIQAGQTLNLPVQCAAAMLLAEREKLTRQVRDITLERDVSRVMVDDFETVLRSTNVNLTKAQGEAVRLRADNGKLKLWLIVFAVLGCLLAVALIIVLSTISTISASHRSKNEQLQVAYDGLNRRLEEFKEVMMGCDECRAVFDRPQGW